MSQALSAVAGRRTRSVLTAAGIALGIGATVATVGVTASASGAITDRFDAVRATLVTVRFADGQPRPAVTISARVQRLNGVVNAGLLCQAKQEVRVGRVAPDLADGAGRPLNLVAAQPAALAALGVSLTAGRFFDDGHGARGTGVGLLDTVAARDLGLDIATNPTVWVDGTPVTILGVFAAPAGEARLTSAIVIPYEPCVGSVTADRFTAPEEAIRTTLGAADQVASEARLALSPENPEAVEALVPPDLRTFRRGVEGDTRSLFLGLGVVALVIGALGVSNTTLVSVLERRSEIGLRRAVGASRAAIAGQFLVESALLGFAGGVLGTVIGIDVTAVVSLAQGWLVVLDPALLVAGPAVGVLVGMLAGLYPAYSASRVTPTQSLRSS